MRPQLPGVLYALATDRLLRGGRTLVEEQPEVVRVRVAGSVLRRMTVVPAGRLLRRKMPRGIVLRPHECRRPGLCTHSECTRRENAWHARMFTGMGRLGAAKRDQTVPQKSRRYMAGTSTCRCVDRCTSILRWPISSIAPRGRPTVPPLRRLSSGQVTSSSSRCGRDQPLRLRVWGGPRDCRR
jgi:hypothetical protein